MSTISVIINTFNEEQNLPRVLSSVKNLADEIIVVDMHSTDQTVSIAKKAGAKVFTHERTQYVEPARNFAISKAKGEWILILDADEKLSNGLKSALRQIAKNPTGDFYRIPRKNYIFGKWVKHSRWWPDYNIRFFKKGVVVWDDTIHSVPITNGIAVQLDAEEKNSIIHYHYDTVDQYLEKLYRYTTIQARKLHLDGYKFNWIDLLKRPSGEFLSRYFAGQGYKDGVHGLALASLQAVSELVVYLKVWQLQGFSEERPSLKQVIAQMRLSEKEYHYWQADSLYQEYGSMTNRLKRKFKLP